MFDSWLSQLVSKHARTGILLDSNLLLVYGVGTLNPSLISNEKGTREYSAEDFQLLTGFLSRFDRILTTPNIMTEVSNLAGRLRKDVKLLFNQLLRDNLLRDLEEQYIETSTAASHAVFESLGITDAAIGHLADQGILVLTNDLDLSIFLESRRVDCIHYDRVMRPLTLNPES